jgi:hypothetical protein
MDSPYRGFSSQHDALVEIFWTKAYSPLRFLLSSPGASQRSPRIGIRDAASATPLALISTMFITMSSRTVRPTYSAFPVARMMPPPEASRVIMMLATEAYAKTLIGRNEEDKMRGTSRGGQINALGGHDQVRGNLSVDDLYGRRGQDFLIGGLNDDDLAGGLGSDYLVGDYGDDMIFASDGVPDYVGGGPGIDRAWVGELDLIAVAPERRVRERQKYTPPQPGCTGSPMGGQVRECYRVRAARTRAG